MAQLVSALMKQEGHLQERGVRASTHQNEKGCPAVRDDVGHGEADAAPFPPLPRIGGEGGDADLAFMDRHRKTF